VTVDAIGAAMLIAIANGTRVSPIHLLIGRGNRAQLEREIYVAAMGCCP
jgi:hypothetical protein